MKENHRGKFPYTPFEIYCTRTPLLSIEYYFELTGSTEISLEKLHKQIDDPLIAEAIYLASPDLYYQLVRWANGEIKNEKKIQNLKVSLLKYLTRMATRCTPFGLFAALGTGNLAYNTEIELKPYSKFKRHTQFDMNFLVAFGSHLSNSAHIRKQLKFFPNTSIYRIGKRYRYVEYHFKDKRRVYTLESVAHSEYLEKTLNSAKKGTTLDFLIEELIDQGIEEEEARDFIDQLVANQILVSELEPNITGKDYLSVIKDNLSLQTGTEKEIETITELQSLLKNLDLKIGNSIAAYDHLNVHCSELEIPFERKHLVQTDTFSIYNSNTVGSDILRKIKQGIAFLNKIAKPKKHSNLENFKKAFVQRYEHQKVPLLNVMDVEMGIGYVQNPTSLEATPFLDDIVRPLNYGENRWQENHQAPLQTVLHKKLADCIRNRKTAIELTDADFPEASYDWQYAPDTVTAFTEIIVEEGREKVVIDYCGGHATRMLGRFGNGNKEVHDLLNDIVEKESKMNPGAIMAEIIHLPEARTGNILRRPELRGFEIPYLGKSNLPPSQQIALEDILVTVKNDSIQLYSIKNNRPILPRISNAHNYSAGSLPIYHFLCDLKAVEQKGFGFKWGPSFDAYSFLPRVAYKDCIFSKAQWFLTNNDIKMLLEHQNSIKLLLAKVLEWRKSRNMPELVQLVDRDNTLAINLNNYNCVIMFLEMAKNIEIIVLEEFLHVEKPIVESSGKSFCNQFLFSFYNHQKLSKD